jgi:hypothetical protein
MPNKKRVHLQQFGIIHLPNPDLIYIANPERTKILFMPFHLLKTYIRNPSLFFISFFTLPPTGKRRWQPRYARAYIHVRRWVLPSFCFCQVDLSNCWRPIFLVLPKLDECQVGLPNCWSCFKERIIVWWGQQHSNAIRWMTFICKWCFESLNIFFWVQCSKSHQSVLLPFLHPVFPIKHNSLHPHSHIQNPLAPPLPPRGRRPLLPLVSFSPLASSSLPTGGKLPYQGSSTRLGELPHRGAVAWSALGRALPPDLRTLTPHLEGGSGDAPLLTVNFGTPSYEFTINICTYLIS